jgi:hypothetical protein
MSADQELRERNQALMNSFDDDLVEYGTTGEEEPEVQQGVMSNISFHSGGDTTSISSTDNGGVYTSYTSSSGLTIENGSSAQTVHVATIVQTKRTAYCWNSECDKENMVHREKSNVDGPYGHHCPCCNKSLRQHPMFGKGKEYDLGDAEKRRNWHRLNPLEKRNEKKRYKKFKEVT